MNLSKEALEKKRQYAREWRSKNKKRVSEYNKKWRSENKDKVVEYNHRFWEKKAAEEN